MLKIGLGLGLPAAGLGLPAAGLGAAAYAPGLGLGLGSYPLASVANYGLAAPAALASPYAAGAYGLF